jgi:hypothetical protein
MRRDPDRPARDAAAAKQRRLEETDLIQHLIDTAEQCRRDGRRNVKFPCSLIIDGFHKADVQHRRQTYKFLARRRVEPAAPTAEEELEPTREQQAVTRWLELRTAIQASYDEEQAALSASVHNTNKGEWPKTRAEIRMRRRPLLSERLRLEKANGWRYAEGQQKLRALVERRGRDF